MTTAKEQAEAFYDEWIAPLLAKHPHVVEGDLSDPATQEYAGLLDEYRALLSGGDAEY